MGPSNSPSTVRYAQLLPTMRRTGASLCLTVAPQDIVKWIALNYPGTGLLALDTHQGAAVTGYVSVSTLSLQSLWHEGMAAKADAHYTSQACPRCGHTTCENRPNTGLTFQCQRCHVTLHADLIGARNIALRTLLIARIPKCSSRLG